MKTLIVEDDFTCRVLLQGLLQRFGTAHVAVDGKEAVQAVAAARESNEPYDLVCLDIMMDKMDGQEALRQLRAGDAAQDAKGPGTKIVMVSALHDSGNVMNAFRAQADGYLVKPVDYAKLAACLRELELLPQ
jgi:two-component system, chemotaxis family, chemotaxis protein CheY